MKKQVVYYVKYFQKKFWPSLGGGMTVSIASGVNKERKCTEDSRARGPLACAAPHATRHSDCLPIHPFHWFHRSHSRLIPMLHVLIYAHGWSGFITASGNSSGACGPPLPRFPGSVKISSAVLTAAKKKTLPLGVVAWAKKVDVSYAVTLYIHIASAGCSMITQKDSIKD